jgi:surface polysaccharide O-acyltransferase-like enzyme
MAAERRYDIDWLRVFATYLLFFFHIGKVFDVPPEYHIKNDVLSWNIAYFTEFVHQWHMPLFFLLAGWSLYGSFSTRGARTVLGERVRRILVPFLFGCCTLCVGLGYIEKVLMPHKDIAFAQFVPLFFTSLDYFTWGHLWFLIYLFVFTLLYMPLFSALNRRRRAVAGRLNGGWLYAPLVPLTLMQLTLRIWWPGHQNLYDDWGNFTYYSAFFIMGFIMGRNPSIEDAIAREWKRAAALAIPVSAAFLWTLGHREWGDVLRHLCHYILGGATGWLILIAMLGFARKHLQFTNGTLKYAAASALPIYILHQEAITYPGWFVINLPWSVPAKMALLLPLSVLLSLAAYHFAVSRFNVLRVLFGMKALGRRIPPATQEISAAG